ncbi:MAG: MFS transporter [Gammaproteobacteria bacterium CG_4_9_14_3_um_filter_38_9]|nr:MAG: MFS transporter [Gammaproteobacteria bacterium CG_4_9_14_3_um_filter_38_9]
MVIFALLGRVLMGIGAAFAFVGCLKLIPIWFPARRFAFMTAIVETAGMFGAITGNLWIAHFIQQAGWRDCIKMASIFAAILSFFLFLMVRNNPRKKKLNLPKITTVALSNGLKSILRNATAWINGVYCGFMFGLVTVFIALWAIPFLETTHHANLMDATLSASAVYIGMAIGGPLIGWIDEKTAWRQKIMVINAILASILLFIVIFSAQSSLWTISILLFFTGLFASSYVLTYAIANEIATLENRATSIGFTNMFCVLFAPFLQPLIGFLITHFKGDHDYFQHAVSIVPMLMLSSAVIGFYLPKKNIYERRP